MACRIVLLLIFKLMLFPDYSQTVRVDKFGLSDGVVPEKGSDITIKCDVTISGSDVIPLNILKGTNPVATCLLYAGVGPHCSIVAGQPPRYKAKYTQPSAIITITNLQISDSGEWYCGFQTNENTLFTLPVYVSPKSLEGIGGTDGGDLESEQVSLSCSTSNCVYPSVGMYQWFYKKETGQWLLYPNSTPASPQADCSGSERKYSSTLQLPKYTVWPLQSSNIETTVKFKCRLDFPTLQSPLESAISGNVTYAVRVTSVTLKDGIKTPSDSDTIEVITGATKTLTCVTSTSRPVATIVWYIEQEVKQSSTNTEYIYSPKYEDNNKQIYCKAYNIQPESNTVTSNSPKLYVKVKITAVTLVDGNMAPQNDDTIEVTENQEKTLTCRHGDSNPPSIIMWLINGQLKQNATNVNFKFTPTNNDHEKRIQCKAYNIQPPNEAVVSASPKLFVKVLASIPALTNWTISIPQFYSGQEGTLSCRSTPTRPAVTVTWKKEGTSLTNVQNTVSTAPITGLMTVTSVLTFTPQKSDNGKMISCETNITDQNPQISENSISVWWPPTTPSIPNDSFPWLEDQQQKQLTCSSNDYGNPHADIQWTSTVGSSASDKLNLPQLTQDYNGLNVTCQLTNKYTQKMNVRIISQVIQLNILYKPDVFINIDDIEKHSVVKNEGQTLTAICSAKGNPEPTVSWQGRSPGSNKLEFTDIDRQNHGVYNCTAHAQSSNYPSYNFSNETALDVTVNFAPDVDVVINIEEPTENSSLLISCTPSGRPAEYHFTSMVQKFGGTTIPNTHEHVNGILDIPNLQLQDSGMYTCTANNGIRDRNQQLDQTGEKTMRVRVSPKVLSDSFTFAGAPGRSVNITVPFYSNPDILHVKFKFKNGSEIHNSGKHKVSYESQKVTAKFYGTSVELDGYIAVLHIEDEEEADFVDYILELGNNLGPLSQWTLHHVSESIPLVPKFINFTGEDGGVPTFLLLGNFNGGLIQTFVIETSTENSEIWEEQLRFNETDMNHLQQTKDENLLFRFNITGLSANTYIVRVLAGNDLGWIDESSAPTARFTLHPADNPGAENKSALVGAIAGSSAGVLVAAAVIVVIIWKKRIYKKGEGTTALNRCQNEADSSDDEGMTENVAYVSADEVGIAKVGAVPDSMYAQPQKRNKKVIATPGDVYSTVNKSKAEDPRSLYAMPDKRDAKTKKKTDGKGKAGKGPKKGKAKRDDVYENSSELTTVSKTGAYEENPYENPEETKPKVNRNKDGLIYADLTFNDQPKGQKKLVIHGLDSMTEYVEVDFTKKADPLPDSDDETKDNN